MNHLINFISIHFNQIALNTYGKKIILKLIEKVNVEESAGANLYFTLKSKIQGNVLKMAVDEKGNIIISKFIELIPSPFNDFIYEEIFKSFLNIVNTKFGCFVIEKCILNGNAFQKKEIINLIMKSTYGLISSQFGNYVYQCFLLNVDDFNMLKIYKMLSRDIIQLSKEKYSSNAIEKLFEIKNKKLVNRIAKNILQEEEQVVDLICNEYGNYIIRKIIYSVNNKNIKDRINNIIRKNIDRINSNSFGYKFLQKLEKDLGLLFF